MTILTIDPGASLTGLCYGEGDPSLVALLKIPKLPMIERLINLRGQVVNFIAFNDIHPNKIVIEWPPFMARRPGQTLVYAAAGVIIGTLGDLAPIELVWPSTWKKVVCQNGNASKDLVKLKIMERWPTLSDKLKQDCYDAVGIWTYATRME